MNFTHEQCSTKWRNMLRTYKKFIDNTKNTDDAPLPKPVYFDDIHGLVHDNHAVNPTNIYDSGVSQVLWNLIVKS